MNQLTSTGSQGGGVFGLLQVVSWVCALAVAGLGVTGLILTFAIVANTGASARWIPIWIMSFFLLVGSVVAVVGGLLLLGSRKARRAASRLAVVGAVLLLASGIALTTTSRADEEGVVVIVAGIVVGIVGVLALMPKTAAIVGRYDVAAQPARRPPR